MRPNTKNVVLGLIFLALLMLVFVGALYLMSNASGLSDETLEIVEDLRMKHYGQYMFFDADEITADWTTFYPYIIHFEDGILYIETRDCTWFLEMERKED